MVKLVPVSEEEKELIQRRRLGRLSWTIIKQFEESELDIARIETERNPGALAYTLRTYIKQHRLPYKIMVRRGNLYIAKEEEEQEIPALNEEAIK